MARKIAEMTLTDGTVVRHKVSGYRGLIDGTTALQNCFTKNGLALTLPAIAETFQYRIAWPAKSFGGLRQRATWRLSLSNKVQR